MSFTRASVLLLLLLSTVTVCMAQVKKTCKSSSECTKNQYCNTAASSECEILLKFGDTCTMDNWCQSKNCLDTGKCAKDPKPLLGVPAIAGISAGGVLLLCAVLVCCFCVIKKKRANKSADPEI